MKWEIHRYKTGTVYDITFRDVDGFVLIYGSISKTRVNGRWVLYTGYGTTQKDYCYMETFSNLKDAKVKFESTIYQSLQGVLKQCGRVRRCKNEL